MSFFGPIFFFSLLFYFILNQTSFLTYTTPPATYLRGPGSARGSSRGHHKGCGQPTPRADVRTDEADEVVYPAQPRGDKAAPPPQPTTGLRPPPGPGCHEDRRPGDSPEHAPQGPQGGITAAAATPGAGTSSSAPSA